MEVKSSTLRGRYRGMSAAMGLLCLAAAAAFFCTASARFSRENTTTLLDAALTYTSKASIATAATMRKSPIADTTPGPVVANVATRSYALHIEKGTRDLNNEILKQKGILETFISTKSHLTSDLQAKAIAAIQHLEALQGQPIEDISRSVETVMTTIRGLTAEGRGNAKAYEDRLQKSKNAFQHTPEADKNIMATQVADNQRLLDEFKSDMDILEALMHRSDTLATLSVETRRLMRIANFYKQRTHIDLMTNNDATWLWRRLTMPDTDLYNKLVEFTDTARRQFAMDQDELIKITETIFKDTLVDLQGHTIAANIVDEIIDGLNAAPVPGVEFRDFSTETDTQLARDLKQDAAIHIKSLIVLTQLYILEYANKETVGAAVVDLNSFLSNIRNNDQLRNDRDRDDDIPVTIARQIGFSTVTPLLPANHITQETINDMKHEMDNGGYAQLNNFRDRATKGEVFAAGPQKEFDNLSAIDTTLTTLQNLVQKGSNLPSGWK